MVQRASVVQRENPAMLNILGSHFTPGLRPLQYCEARLTAPVATITLPTTGTLPQNYRGLLICGQARSDEAAEGDGLRMRFNGDSGNNYDWVRIDAQDTVGVSVAGTRAAVSIYTALVEAANSRANTFTPFCITILGYALTDREKVAFIPSSGTFGNVSSDADLWLLSARGRWRSTAAITSITWFLTGGDDFVSGSHFIVYGML